MNEQVSTETWQQRTGGQRPGALSVLSERDQTVEELRTFEHDYAESQNRHQARLAQAVQEGAVIHARASDDPDARWAQEQIDLMLKQHPAWQDKRIDFYIHRDCPPSPTNPDFQPIRHAAATYPENVEMGERLWNLFKDDPKKLKVLLAHEISHSINGDNTAARMYASLKAPKNHHNEILANRMGAILFGNPKEFGEYLFRFMGGDETPTHPSWQQLREQSTRWSALLEQNGVLDNEGNITDTAKALSVYETSKHTAAAEYATRGNIALT
jgi:hypothetical protein